MMIYIRAISFEEFRLYCQMSDKHACMHCMFIGYRTGYRNDRKRPPDVIC